VELADGERVLFCGHPSWRSMVPFYVKGLLLAVVVGAAAGVLSAVASSGSVEAGWVVAAVLVVFAIVLCAGFVNRTRMTYTISTRRLTLETGLLARDIHETRLDQVQSVTASQSLVERLMDVGTVAFDTPSGSAFTFTGVARPRRLVRVVNQALDERPLPGRRVTKTPQRVTLQ
jgi:uncharacterized membrane protein YdbT with pleckstrin-like domain